MRVAAIDVGTNSTRLLVADGLEDSFRPIDRRMTITRLGQGVEATRSLDPDALERTLTTIADYAAACGDFGVQKLRVTGTSAVRDARNRSEFFEGVKTLTGQEPELLSGEEEARATFLGATIDLQHIAMKLIVDIGGGSTELVVGTREPDRLISLNVGCVRMFEKYLHSDPPTEAELDALRGEVGDALEEAVEELEVPTGTTLVGVAGTVAQLAVLKTGISVYDPEITHHAILTHGDVRRIARRLRTLPYAQRKQISGLEPGRVDVIVAGAEILQLVLEAFDIPEVMASEKDILDGLVMQLLG